MVKLLSYASIDKVMTLSNPLVTNEKLTKTAVKVLHHSSLSSSSSSDTVQGSVLLPHYRTLEVRSCTASVCCLIKTY